MAITPYYATLIEKNNPNCPIRKMVIPDVRELPKCQPLLIEEDKKATPCKGIIHKYPDRLIFMPSLECAVYCRFCFRKNMPRENLTPKEIKKAINYIRKTTEIRDVLITGGDPLSYLMKNWNIF
jgi:lysine 2,3-aminomutase